MKVLMVIVSDKKSCLYFQYQNEFVKQLSQQKKKYGLFWSTENKRWEFNTASKDEVKDFLQDDLEASVVTDDRRKESNDHSNPQKHDNNSSPHRQVEKVKMYDSIKTPNSISIKKPLYTLYSDEEEDRRTKKNRD
jgi:hypothetical protein